jgi:hypothetical protein
MLASDADTIGSPSCLGLARKTHDCPSATLRKKNRCRCWAKEIIERITQEFIASMEQSVALGHMTAEQAAEKFAAFQQQMREMKSPTRPN